MVSYSSLILSSVVWLRKRSEAREDKRASGFATEIWIYGITKGELHEEEINIHTADGDDGTVHRCLRKEGWRPEGGEGTIATDDMSDFYALFRRRTVIS